MIAVPKRLIAFSDVTLYMIVTKQCILPALVRISQKTAEKPQVTRLAFTYFNIYENMISLYYSKGNGQNDSKSLFLNAFINVEISSFTNWL